MSLVSLYDEASLWMTPSGAKDGKLFSELPTDGSGDFTFSRGSNLAATRVGPTGLIEKGRENLAYNSDWSGVSTDTNPTGWTQFLVGTGTFNATGTSGQIRLQTSDASSRVIIYSNTIGTNGILAVSAYVDAVATTIQLSNLISRSATSTQLLAFEDGVEISYSDNIQAGKRYLVIFNQSAPTEYRFGVGTSSSVLGDVTISRPQIEQGLVATEYIPSPVGSTGKAGLLEDEPRLDYSGGATCPSLLLEPSRTNLVKQSEYFNVPPWSEYVFGGASLTRTFGYESPEGNNNAYKFDVVVGAGGVLLTDNITINPANAQTLSVYMKGENGGEKVMLALRNSGSAGASGDIMTLTSEWARYNVTLTTDSADRGFQFRMLSSNGVVDQTIYVYGAQLESGSYPTSYIPNHSGGSVTRGADICYNATDDFAGADQVTLFAELDNNGNDRSGSFFRFNLNQNTSTSEWIFLGYESGKAVRFYVRSNASTSVDRSAGNYGAGTLKMAAKIDSEGNYKLFANGVQIAYGSNAVFSPSLNRINIGQTNGTTNMEDRAKQLLVFPTALTDSECIKLTTL